jgi:hypothetical protein
MKNQRFVDVYTSGCPLQKGGILEKFLALLS